MYKNNHEENPRLALGFFKSAMTDLNRTHSMLRILLRY